MVELEELDSFWYKKLYYELPSGEMRAIGRFAFSILREIVKLSKIGYTSFPAQNRGYILEKMLCIIERTGIEENILEELAKHRGQLHNEQT